MGRDDARELAVALIAAYEGIALLANTLRDPALISTEVRRLERLDRLAGRTPAGPSAGLTVTIQVAMGAPGPTSAPSGSAGTGWPGVPGRGRSGRSAPEPEWSG